VGTTSRLGITVSKKVDKRSVGRNYIKRCIREVFRVNSPNFAEIVDIVVIAKPSAAGKTFSEISDQIWQCFRSKGLLGRDGTQ
jgi:ribonuclease P protein component